MSESPIALVMCLITMTFALIGAMLVIMRDSPEPVDPYCEMVGIWIETGGEYGWPDYRGSYHTECAAIQLEGGAPSTTGGGE